MGIKEDIFSQEQRVRNSKIRVAKIEAEIATIEKFFDKMSSISTTSLLSMISDLNISSAVNRYNSTKLESEYSIKLSNLKSELFYSQSSLKKEEEGLKELKEKERNGNLDGNTANCDKEKINELKDKISKSEKEILRREIEVESFSTQIEILKKIASDISSNKTMSALSMISDFNPLSTLNYTQNMTLASDISRKISGIQSSRTNSMLFLNSENSILKSYLKQLEYLERDEAKFIEKNGQIFIKGDESNTDITKRAKDLITNYIEEFENLKNNENVKKFAGLKKQLIHISKDDAIPVASQEILYYANTSYNKAGCLVINDKLFSSKDFIGQEISKNNEANERYRSNIKESEEKINNFNPSFIGKIIKPIGKRQREKFVAENSCFFSHSQLERNEKENLKLKELQEKYIKPIEFAMPITMEVIEKMNSPEVKKYIENGNEMNQRILDNTILKGLNIHDIRDIFSPEVNKYLEDNKLKINVDKLMEIISKNKDLGKLSQEICNAIDYIDEKSNNKDIQMQ